VSTLEFGPVPSWNHAVGAAQKLATITRFDKDLEQFLAGT